MDSTRPNGLRALLLALAAALSGCALHAGKTPMITAPPAVVRDETTILAALAPGLPRVAIIEALAAMDCAKTRGIAPSAERLAIVDYTRPSREQRLWVFDLAEDKLLFHEFVAHGRGSGLDVATSFSNRNASHQTSLGLFVTDETYDGGNGYSLKLRGLSGELNDLAFERKIVLHGAPYVDPAMIDTLGRLGRSFGCPAVRPQVARPLIDTLKEGQFLYAYGPGSHAGTDCERLDEQLRMVSKPDSSPKTMQSRATGVSPVEPQSAHAG